MRICLITTLKQAGDDVVYYKHACSLAKNYKDITIVAPASPEPADAAARSIRFRWLQSSTSPLGRVGRLLEVVNVIRHLSPDVCHFYDLDVLAVVPWLSRASKIAPVYDALEAWPERMLCSRRIPGWLRPFAATCTDRFEKMMARRCSLVFTADTATAEDFERRSLKAVTLFNYPPLFLYGAESTPEPELQSRYQHRLIGIYSGTISEDRGLFQMLKATAKVCAVERSFLLMLIGLADGKLKKQAEQLIEALKIRDNVEIHSWVPHTEVGAYLKMAKVGLVPLQPIPKYYKNIAQKTFEYMACGLPIVGSNLPTIGPFINEAKAGVVADCSQPELMAEAILRVIQNKDEWLEMSRNGRQAFLRRYNWETMEERLLGAYGALESMLRNRLIPEG